MKLRKKQRISFGLNVFLAFATFAYVGGRAVSIFLDKACSNKVLLAEQIMLAVIAITLVASMIAASKATKHAHKVKK
jgi:hypothetical protein